MTPELSGAGWRVFRDPAGVPHVQGSDLKSLATGHGAITAVDRPWQLEVLRRRAEGRSAELLGPDQVDADHLSLAMEIELTALRWWKAAGTEDQQFLAAYADGVNGSIGSAWAECPEALELGLADLEPRPWQPWTPLAVHLDAHLLSGSLPEQVWRHRVRTTLGDEWVAVLDAETPRGSGSNAWLVPADLSVSGAPLIAADPHRVVEESGPYQPVCFSAPGLRVRGLALVGLPGVPHFGRTESAAWAITAAMTTTETLCEVTVQRRTDGLVAVDTGESLDERAVDLRSAHCGTQTRWVRRCSGGFVLPGDAGAEQRLLALAEGECARVLVVRPAVPCAPERAVSACRELLGAISVADVAAAWQGWVVPVNDVIAADRTGACLHTVAGSYLPAPCNDDAAAPVGAFGSVGSREPSGATHARGSCGSCGSRGSRGSRGEHLDHVMVRANQRPADEHESAARLGCAPPHRARRATQLLEQAIAERGVVSHEDLLAAQVDTHLGTWPGLLAQLLGDRGPVAKTLRDWLLAWDGDMSADSEVAALFARWRDAFARELAASEVLTPLLASSRLPALWQPFLDPVARVGLALESIVVRGQRVGFDPRVAAVRALDSVAAEHPEAMDAAGSRSVENQPSWGLLHAFAPHRAHPDLPPFTAVPVGGDTDCLLSAGTIPGWGPACAHVPAARVLWDLADPAASWWITPDPVDRGSLGSAPVLRWAAGEMDHALPWVPAGGLEPTDAPLGLGRLSDGLAAVGRPFVPVVGSAQDVNDVVSGHLSLRPVDAARDCELIYSWVQEERARFWGMNDLTFEQVRDLYAFLSTTTTHHAWLIELNQRPLGLFQTYEPHADITGAFYTVEPGDLGIHVLLAPVRNRVPGMTDAISALIQCEIIKQGRTRRIVAEPDASNDLALARLQAIGFTLGPVIDLPHKTGRLAFFTLP